MVKVGEKGAYLYQPDFRVDKFVNSMGLLMVSSLSEEMTILDVAKRIADRCGVEDYDDIYRDVLEFFEELMNCHMLVMDSANTEKSMKPPFPEIKDAPRVVDLSITRLCNLNCPYCFYSDDMDAREDISLDQWTEFFSELRSVGVRNVVLSGGEVFMREELWQMIDEIISRGLRFSILTNGTLIDEKVVKKIREDRIFRRLDSIQVSIDGSSSEIHDKSRGKGNFSKSISAIRALKSAGFPLTVRVTINRYNIDDLENIAKLLLEDVHLNSFSVNDALPIGNACKFDHDITITQKQQYQAMKTLAGLEHKYNGRVTASAGPLARWHYFQDMEKARENKEPEYGMGYLSCCGCASVKLAIHHDGTIAPCNMLTGLVIGHINKDSFSRIWKMHPVLQQLRDRKKIPIAQSPGCEDCEWSAYCKGGCPVTIFHETGDFNRANPPDCYRAFLEANEGRKPWLEITNDNRS
ncbi:radical SAM protein [bacterium]|nr:radical SAM protein [bacterium]